MTRHRSVSEVTQFNQFKWGIALLLLLAIVILFFTIGLNPQPTETASTQATRLAVNLPTPILPTPTATRPPLPLFEPIKLPQINAPLPSDGQLPLGATVFTGLGTPNTLINVYVSNNFVEQILIDNNGLWTASINSNIPGNHPIRIIALNSNGNTQAVLNTTYQWEDPSDNPTTAPTLSLESGGQLPMGSLTLNGNAVPNSLVALLVNDIPVGTTSTNSEGQWLLDVDFLEAGTVTIQAQAMNSNLERLPLTSSQKTLTIIATEVIEAIRTNPPTIINASNGGVEITGDWTIIGSGVHSSTISLFINEVLIAITEVNDNGTWQVKTTIDTAGDYRFLAQATDPTQALQIDSELVTLTVSDAQSFAPVITLPRAGDDIAAGDIIIAGVGTPGTTVIILINDVEAERVTVGRDSFWGTRRRYNQRQNLTLVVQSFSDGTVQGTSLPLTFTVNPDKQAQCSQLGIDQVDTYIVGSCDFMAQIARDLDIDIDVLIATNPQIENPNFLRAGQVLNLPARNDDDDDDD